MICYRCKSQPARKGQRTCAECHAKYMREWRPTQRKTREQKAYNRGVEALREALAGVFKSIGSAELSGYTAVQIVSNCAAKVPRETFT
jgi:hypothetical protein